MSLPTVENPLISVLVLNWNGNTLWQGRPVLERCLESLAGQTFRDFEVLVADNASTDGSVDSLEAAWPGLRLLRFEQNLGFSKGNNRAAAQARGRWLAFLNNDAFPRPAWLAALATAIERHPQGAFFASCLVNAGDPCTIQAAGDVLHTSGYAWPRRSGTPLASLPPDLQEVFSASGAAVLYERQAFLDAGGFDEDFGSHLEDVDLGFRLRLRGQRCWLVPQAVVEHIQGASYGVESERTVYQVQRNVTWLFLADMPGGLVWKYLPLHLLATLVLLFNYMRRGRGRAAFRARLDALKGLPRSLRKRRRVQVGAVSPAALDRLLDHDPFSPFLRGRLGARLSGRLRGRPREKRRS